MEIVSVHFEMEQLIYHCIQNKTCAIKHCIVIPISIYIRIFTDVTWISRNHVQKCLKSLTYQNINYKNKLLNNAEMQNRTHTHSAMQTIYKWLKREQLAMTNGISNRICHKFTKLLQIKYTYFDSGTKEGLAIK